MSELDNIITIPDNVVMSKIYVLRDVKVMLDRDLAELYGVETKHLKRQVKRNIIRFPEDFMFELTEQEFKEWRSQFGTSIEDKMGLRYAPYAFTEDGVAQFSQKIAKFAEIWQEFWQLIMVRRGWEWQLLIRFRFVQPD
jgi:hypothetical protein